MKTRTLNQFLGGLTLAGLLLAPAFAREGSQPLPEWDQLTPQQRQALIAPVRARWNDNPDQRARLLRHAERWQQMTPEQRDNARRGAERWEGMSDANREDARVLFQHLRELPEAERNALQERWSAMTPEQRRRWIERHRSSTPRQPR